MSRSGPPGRRVASWSLAFATAHYYARLALMSEPTPAIHREVWAEFKAGDMAAFHLVYETYDDLVFRVVAKYIRSTADREDLVNGIWLHIYERRGTFQLDLGAKGRQWLAKIAFSKCMDFLRRVGKVTPTDDVDTLADLIDKLDDDREDELDLDLRRRVRQARARVLGALHGAYPTMAEFVTHYYDEDMTHQECASAMGLEPRQTKYLNLVFRRALAKDPFFVALRESDDWEAK